MNLLFVYLSTFYLNSIFFYVFCLTTSLELNHLTLTPLSVSARWRPLAPGKGGPWRGGVTPFNGNSLFKKLEVSVGQLIVIAGEETKVG